jgi:hypothetical protein
LDCLPHWRYYNLPPSESSQKIANPSEAKANWIDDVCRYRIIDGYHRKGVRNLNLPSVIWMIFIQSLNIQAFEVMRNRGMSEMMPERVLASIQYPNLSAFGIFVLSERANAITHNHVALTIWDHTLIVKKIRYLW